MSSKVIDKKILIGTHHKTGVGLMNQIFGIIGQNYNLTRYIGDGANSYHFDIFHLWHSNFDFNIIDFDYRGLHIIRDPRDVIVSGMFYHQKADEKWLDEPNDKFDGKSYREMIKGFDSIDDKITFEMENRAKETIDDMISWDYDKVNFYETKLETLMTDYDLFEFHKIFTHLGFPGKHIPYLLKIAYKRSIFSGNLKGHHHVRSGKTSQYKEYFKPEHKERFIELFGDVLIKLGYENDNDW